MVLFSGDGDFRSLVEAMQRRGVKVTVISTIQTQPAMISDELRRQADEFVDLASLSGRIGRDAGRAPGPGRRRAASRYRGEGRPNPSLENRYGIRQPERRGGLGPQAPAPSSQAITWRALRRAGTPGRTPG